MSVTLFDQPRSRRRRGPVVRIVLLVLLIAAGLPGAMADEKSKADKPRGFVDGSRFVELSGADGSLVEVTLGRAMLKVVRRAFARQGNPLADLLAEVESMNAVIIKPEGEKLKQAKEEVESMSRRLEREGWERLARVRESSQEVLVYALTEDDRVIGLTTFVYNGNELIFANIAGPIDLGRLSLLGAMDFPGLDVIPKAVEKQKEQDKTEQQEQARADGTEGEK